MQIQRGSDHCFQYFATDQLGHVVHLHRAIADNRNHWSRREGELSGDGVGHRCAHRRKAVDAVCRIETHASLHLGFAAKSSAPRLSRPFEGETS
jgi:hypothetical protein